MKKIIIVLFAVAFLGGAASSFALNVKETVEAFNPAATTTDKEEIIATVYNSTGAALTTGDVLVWNTTSDDARSVTKGNRLGQPVAGVANETIAAGAWGKMLVYGYHSAVKVAGDVTTGGAASAGYPLYAYGTTDDAVTTNTDAANNGLAGNGATCAYGNATTKPIRPFGMALDSTTTETTVEAFINCL